MYTPHLPYAGHAAAPFMVAFGGKGTESWNEDD